MNRIDKERIEGRKDGGTACQAIENNFRFVHGKLVAEI